ncbi:MAG: hypothetical protein ACI379_06035 [Nocardioides sp.]|uniref:hypothetical protein n=1 Tax=Nocardioides sp. TaxID=35761 RepID=UPI003F032668
MTDPTTTPLRRPLHRAAALAVAALITTLAACGTDPAPTDPDSSGTTSDQEAPAGEQEASHLAPRALVAHPAGLTLIDTETGEVLDEEERDGFLRLNDAGDGRHVMVTDGDLFRVYDTGIRAEAHGDHAHYYVSPAGLTDVSYEAPTAGHVVVHERLTTLFSDGTGDIQVVESGRVAEPGAPVTRHSAGEAHHGVALQLSDDTLLTTQGTEDERHRVEVRDGAEVVAETDECPGVHGETTASPTAKGDVVVLGCEDGPVVYRNGRFHKVDVADDYARVGNLAGHHDSPVVLGDYKVDPDAELERPTRVSLTDTRTDTLRTVELGSAYWFRSLARGPHGEAVVLTYDGSLRVIDPTTGKQTSRIATIGAWSEPDDWQQPGPVLKVVDSTAYVTDPASDELVVVDLEQGEVVNRVPVPTGTVELTVTDGVPAWEDEHSH